MLGAKSSCGIAQSKSIKIPPRFQAVFREGLRRHSSHFTLRALRPSIANTSSLNTATKTHPVSDLQAIPSTLIGVSISTKVSKKAVVRNRLKRQITAAMQQLLPQLAPGWKLVLIVKPTAAESECVSQQFLQELKQLLVETEVLNGHS